MFNVLEKLNRNDHQTIPFSISYNKNIQTQYSKYFVEPLGGRDEVYFDGQTMTPLTFIRTFSRLFYSKEVEKALSKLIFEKKPQVAYILHYLRKLSPSVLIALKKCNIPIIARLSDYGMICPQGHCFRDESPCTLCIKGRILPSIQYRCVKNSYSISLLNAIATKYHKFRKYFDLIDKFVVTNQFMYRMMIEAGYAESKLICLPTFTDINVFKPTENYIKTNYICYIGRLEYIKGVHILIDAFSRLYKKGLAKNIILKIAGAGSDTYQKKIKNKVNAKKLNSKIHFVGQINAKKISELLSNALFSVVPSLCFENQPNSIIESFACGTPVIASDIGSLSECIKVGETGFLFNLGDAEDLAQKMELCFNNKTLLKEMAFKSCEEALRKYSPDFHVNSLINIFNKYI